MSLSWASVWGRKLQHGGRKCKEFYRKMTDSGGPGGHGTARLTKNSWKSWKNVKKIFFLDWVHSGAVFRGAKWTQLSLFCWNWVYLAETECIWLKTEFISNKRHRQMNSVCTWVYFEMPLSVFRNWVYLEKIWVHLTRILVKPMENQQFYLSLFGTKLSAK